MHRFSILSSSLFEQISSKICYQSSSIVVQGFCIFPKHIIQSRRTRTELLFYISPSTQTAQTPQYDTSRRYGIANIFISLCFTRNSAMNL